MGQSLSSVHAASFDGVGRGNPKFPVPSDDEDQLPPGHQSPNPLPPPPAEPSTAPMSPQTAPTQPSSVAGATTQHDELSENDDSIRTSDESISPTKVKTIGQPETVKNDQEEDVTQIPVGRGALRKVYNILKGVAFAERSEVRKLPNIIIERGQDLSDSLRETDLENRFKPKRGVFLRGGKRGAPDIVPKQSIIEPKRGAVWPSRARPHRTQTVLLSQKQRAEPLTITSQKTTEEVMSESPIDFPEVDMNRNTLVLRSSDFPPFPVDGRKSPEETLKNYCIVYEGIQLERKSNESSSSTLEEREFLSDMEKAHQLSLKDNWPPDNTSRSVEKTKRDLEDSEDEQFQKDLGEACKRSLLDNWTPEPLELDEDPEATISPLQSDDEQVAPVAEAIYRFLKEPYEQSEPLDLSKDTAIVPSVDSKEQTPEDQATSHSPKHNIHRSPSPQPGPSSSKAVGKIADIFPLTEEQQFLRDMELARQLSMRENWKHGMDAEDSSDED